MPWDGDRPSARADSALGPIRRVSQIRQYADEPVPDEMVEKLLEFARWTGSSKNTQPWHLVVVRDKETLGKLAALRPNITWLAGAPLGIAIVLDGANALSEAYDEGRLTERLLTGATLLGYGGGVAWFFDREQPARRILGIPDDRTAHQIVMIGRPVSAKDPRPTGPPRGRRPLSDLVSYERWGEPKR